MLGNRFSGACLGMEKLLSVAAAAFLMTAGVASATTVSVSYSVTESGYSGSYKPSLTNFLGTLSSGIGGAGSTYTTSEILTSGTQTLYQSFFTADPTGSCGTASSCAWNATPSPYTQVVSLLAAFTFSETPTTGSWAGIKLTGTLTQVGTYEAKYSGAELPCSFSGSGESDCVNWSGAGGNTSSTKLGHVEDTVTFADGDTLDVFFQNAQDWDITPKISFEFFACGTAGGLSCISKQSTTPLPGAVWLFGTVLTGAAGVGGWRRRKGKAAATSAA